MTLSVSANPTRYTGTGANTALSTVFHFFTGTDIVVKQRITATGVVATLTSGVHYNVTGGSTSGAIGTVTPIAGATDFTTAMTWTLERVIPLTQATDYIDNNTFPAASHETALDKLTMQVQDLEQRLDRAILLPVTDLPLVSEVTNSVDRASKALTFDANGNATVSTQTTTGYGRVLIASTTVAASSTATLTSTDWPATYDIVELEMIDVMVSTNAYLVMKPIDNGSATTSNLVSNSLVTRTGGLLVADSSSSWILDATYTMGTTADDALSGLVRFTHSQSGYVTGFGNFTFMNSTTHYGQLWWGRVTTAVQTSVDGFEISLDTGTITGTFRLWGIPKL